VTTTLLAAIVVLGAVIFVHELGHFLAAKAVGIGVPRFSIGFGPVTPLRARWGETEYVVSWIPLGGYVKMATAEEEGAVAALEGGEAGHFPPEKLFEHKPLAARVLVLSAGVLMNAALAWAIYTGLALGGTQAVDPVTRLAVVDTAGLPAEAAPLAAVPFGTVITRVNDDTVASWNDVLDALLDPGSERLRFDFAAGVDPVIVRIPGTNAEARARLYSALHNLREARIGSLDPGSPAEKAGLEPGDLIVRVDADTVRYWDELTALVRPRPDAALRVTVVRSGVALEIGLTTAAAEGRDPATGRRVRVGQLGIFAAEQQRRVEFTPTGAVAEGWRQTVRGVRVVVVTVRGLILGQVSPKELGGPILIGQLSGQAARAGVPTFLEFMAFVSISLGVFNLLPIPVLDGGHLVFLLLEGMRGGRPVSVAWRLRLTQLGMVLLLALVVLVVYNDILRVFGLR
jgi:regulator of sigma E protease